MVGIRFEERLLLDVLDSIPLPETLGAGHLTPCVRV